ncbi:unnamed protein product [Chrysoparadoxa australica]
MRFACLAALLVAFCHYPALGYVLRPSGWHQQPPCRASCTSMRLLGKGGSEVKIVSSDGSQTTFFQRKSRRQRRPDLKWLDSENIQASAAALLEDEGDDYEYDEYGMVVGGDSEGAAGVEAKDEEDYNFFADKIKVYKFGNITFRTEYGFWTWQVIGAVLFLQLLKRLAKKGFSIRKATTKEVRWEYVVTEPEHLKELHAYRCEDCGYTMYPARNRHDHFFTDVKDFKCPECDAPREKFYDVNDEDDPRNQKPEEESEEVEAAEGEGEGEGEGGTEGEKEEAGKMPMAELEESGEEADEQAAFATEAEDDEEGDELLA